MKPKHAVKALLVLLVSWLHLAPYANAQVLVIDMQRVEREAIVSNDFDAQTGKLREQIRFLRLLIRPGGLLDQEAADLESQERFMDEQTYAQSRKALENRTDEASAALQTAEAILEAWRGEALQQINRAQADVLSSLKETHEAYDVRLKSDTPDDGDGIDVTAQYIAMLDELLPVVTLTQYEPQE